MDDARRAVWTRFRLPLWHGRCLKAASHNPTPVLAVRPYMIAFVLLIFRSICFSMYLRLSVLIGSISVGFGASNFVYRTSAV